MVPLNLGEKMKVMPIIASVGIGLSVMFLSFVLSNNQMLMPIKVYYNMLSAEAKQEITCLADNIFYESAFEPREGKLAVAFVTLNRTKHDVFGESICEVVKQKTGRTCQFSWYCQEKLLTKNDNPVYNEILKLATYVYVNHDKMEDPSGGALFYHADYVKPGWKNMQKTAVIGRHIFYIRKDFL